MEYVSKLTACLLTLSLFLVTHLVQADPTLKIVCPNIGCSNDNPEKYEVSNWQCGAGYAFLRCSNCGTTFTLQEFGQAMDRAQFSGSSSQYLTASIIKGSRLEFPALRQISAVIDLGRLESAHQLSMSALQANNHDTDGDQLIRVIPQAAIESIVYAISASYWQNVSVRLQHAILFTLMTLMETEGATRILQQTELTDDQLCLFYSIFWHMFHSETNGQTVPPNYMMQYGLHQFSQSYIAAFDGFTKDGIGTLPAIISAGSDYQDNIERWLTGIGSGTWDIRTLWNTGPVGVMRDGSNYQLMLASGNVLSGDLNTIISFATLGHFPVVGQAEAAQEAFQSASSIVMGGIAITLGHLLIPELSPWQRLFLLTSAGAFGWWAGHHAGLGFWQSYSERPMRHRSDKKEDKQENQQ